MKTKRFEERKMKLVVVHPDSSDGRKDFYISQERAKALFDKSQLDWDATNGGFAPNASTPTLQPARIKFHREMESIRDSQRKQQLTSH